MEFNVPKTHELFRQMIREFVENEVKPIAAEVDEEERFTQSDSDVNKKILTYCEKPRSRFDLANELGYDSTYYMVTKYLRPLVESGKLKMVLPNMPKRKNQKYVTEHYTGVW